MILRTFTEAAAELDIDIDGVRALVRGLKIQTLPVPRNGSAKGLDESHMAILRKALGRDEPGGSKGRKARPRAAQSARS